MFVTAGNAATLNLTLPAGAAPSRYRVGTLEGFGPWIGATTLPIVVSADNNELEGSDPIEGRVVEVDVGSDIITTTYLVVSDEPLQLMVNSFVTMSEAGIIAASRRDVAGWSTANYIDKLTAMMAAYEILVGYRYFIYYERDDWGVRQYAGYGLPFCENFESIENLENYTASEFAALRKDFIKRIKTAQVVAAATILQRAASEAAGDISPLASDPNLLSEKIGDTSRTWRAARVSQSAIGAAAARLLSDYISSTPRLVRS